MYSCNTKKAENAGHLSKVSDTVKVSVENFKTFYKQFYKDSLFQVGRVVFPLKGYNQALHTPYEDISVESEEEYFTSKDKWQFMLPPPAKDKDLIVKLIRDKDLVIETITANPPEYAPGFGIERHFHLQNGKWFLVYYKYFDN